jgi:hypothetical protein
VAKQKVKLGPDHPDTLLTMNNLANAHQSAKRPDLAIPLFEETLKRRKARLGPDNPDTLSTMNNLADAYWKATHFDLALPIAQEHLTRLEKQLGRAHRDTQTAMANLGGRYMLAGRLPESVPLLEEAYKSSLYAEDMKIRAIAPRLFGAYVQLRMAKEAVTLSNDMQAYVRKQLPKESFELASTCATCGWELQKAGASAEAEPVLRENLAIMEKTKPGSLATFKTRSVLGASLLDQKKYAEAKPLLEAAYEAMKARERAIPPQGRAYLTDALGYLVRFYLATGNKEEQQKWAKLLEEQQARDGKRIEPVHEVANELKLTGQLDAVTPALFYQVRLKAGAQYVIDMVSPDARKLDPYLQVRDATGVTLAEDDDSGGNLNARVFFRAPSDGIYRIRAMSFGPPQGDFTLTVRLRP